VNRIADVKLLASWTWGLKPYDRSNPIAEIRLPGSASIFPPLHYFDHLTFICPVRAELVYSAECRELSLASSRLCRRQGGVRR
jgi:hypothetical protein